MEDVPYEYAHPSSEAPTKEFLCGRLAKPSNPSNSMVMLLPNVLGVKTFDEARAAVLCSNLQTNVLVVDLYGEKALPRAWRDDRAKASPVAFPLMNEHLADPVRLRGKLQAALDAGKRACGATKVAAVGFCFGGACALEMLRAGMDLKAVVSLHGTIDAMPVADPGGGPPPKRAVEIPHRHTPGAHVLVATGIQDPLVPRPKLAAFEEEMSRAPVAEWTVLAVGNAKHAFTDNPSTPAGAFGGYHEAAARQSWNATLDLLRCTLELPDTLQLDHRLWARLTKM